MYQPDIPQNAGALLRLGACLGVPVDIIEPCGFLFSDRHMQRAGMDYLSQAEWARHESWDRFLETTGDRRLILSWSIEYGDGDFQHQVVLSAVVPPAREAR